MIRQKAFIGNTKMLKGGLHCHTTRSDGSLSPEETEKLHAENGYDFLAITDHRRYNRTDFAPEANLLIIPGMEIDSTFEREKGFRTFHCVVFGKNDESNGFSDGEHWEAENVKNQEEFQKYLDELHKKNNLTFYCHPQWSSTPTKYFDKLQGNFAMEIWNSGSVIENRIDDNAPYWDEMLELGHKIWGVAVDDGHIRIHHCKGWVMVNAEKNVESVLDALENGKFYSSTGPVIRDFYIDDNGHAHVEAENVKEIYLIGPRHPMSYVTAEDSPTGFISHAEFDIFDKNQYIQYVRAAVIDKDGKRAWTNPIFFDERAD